MAVGFESVGVGASAAGNFDTSLTAGFDHQSSGGCAVVGMSFAAGNFQFLWYIDTNELSDLTRTVSYGGVPMQSTGVVAWGGDEHAWIEQFVLFNAPAGKQRIEGKVFGGVSSYRNLELSVATYTGVDSVGEAIEQSGTGTAMTISGTAAVNDRFVGVFSTQSGISNFNGDQRYNSGNSLLIGDALGTGSSQNVTATRQKAGKWAGILLPLNAADTVASSAPLAFSPRFDPVKVKREQRAGGLQRNVFTVEAPEV